MPTDHPTDPFDGQLNIVVGDIVNNTGIIAIGNNITIVVNGRTYIRPFAGVPPKPSIFVGREDMLQEIKTALFNGGNFALSALGGKPGVGKTALATVLAWDGEVLAHFSGGTLWAGLGQSPDVDSILLRWADALGVDASKETETSGRIAMVQAGLNGRTPLIVLDDVWRSEDASDLLKVGNPGTAYLLTTRSPIIALEFAPVAHFDVTELTEAQAVELLVRLCPAVSSYREQLADISAACGYLPLALRLIGGYMADNITFTEEADQVLASLAETKSWLGLTDPERKLTLEEIIELSVNALPPAAHAAFEDLAPFAPKPDSFTLAAAKAVTDSGAAAIGTMVRRNLLEKLVDERINIHQSIAAIAAHRCSNRLVANERHARYYLELMNADLEGWQAIEPEWKQIKHAWQWISSSLDAQDLILSYIRAAQTFQIMRGYWYDEIDWLRRGLELTRQNNLLIDESILLNNIGWLYDATGDKHQALAHLRQALSIHRQIDNPKGEAATLSGIGKIYSDLGEQQALTYLQQALPIQKQIGDRSGEATTINNIGLVYSALGDAQQAVDYYQRSLAIIREMGDLGHEAATLNNIGRAYSDLSNWQQALDYFQQSLTIIREIGDFAHEAITLDNMGKLYSDLGDQQQALDYYQKALPISKQVGDRACEARILNNIGLVYDALGNQQQALAYYQQALPIRQQVGDRAGEAATLNNVAMVYSTLGDQKQALVFYQQALTISREVGDRAGEATTLNNIGLAYHTLGNEQQALDNFQRSLLIRQQVGDRVGEGTTLYNIAGIYLTTGDLGQAQTYLEQALVIAEQVKYPMLIKATREALEYVRARLGQRTDISQTGRWQARPDEQPLKKDDIRPPWK